MKTVEEARGGIQEAIEELTTAARSEGRAILKARLIGHLERVVEAARAASEKRRARPRSHSARWDAARAYGEVVGILIALAELDERFGEGYAVTGRRYGVGDLWTVKP